MGCKNDNKKDICFNEINGYNINKINAGSNHFGFVDNKYNAYLFGLNKDLQCNSDSVHSFVEKPKKITLNSVVGCIYKTYFKMYNIKCGSDNTILKTINDDYYACGNCRNNKSLIKKKYEKNVNCSAHFVKIDIEYIKECIGSNNKIIDIIPCLNETLILQCSS